jgi:hypothetical protein
MTTGEDGVAGKCQASSAARVGNRRSHTVDPDRGARQLWLSSEGLCSVGQLNREQTRAGSQATLAWA